jgi:putative tryptophan/tyrosine transport system substrate-binding protein
MPKIPKAVMFRADRVEGHRMTSRRRFIGTAFATGFAPSVVLGQSRPVRIGLLGPAPLNISVYAGGVLNGFRNLGYREKQGTTFDYRSTNGDVELYARQAKELVESNCDLFVAIGAEAPVRALQALRPPAPILFLAVDYDPIDRGIVTDIRAPDRNTTGVYVPQNALVAKRLEVMREILPRAKRVVVFADRFSADQIAAARRGAQQARFELKLVQFDRQPYDYDGALASARKEATECFMNLASPVFARDRQLIAHAVAKHRIAGMGSNPLQADAGYLLALSSNTAKATRRVADIGVRLLRGAKPAEIPIEQADEFELVINAKTAKALGLRIPPAVTARATRITE